MAGTKLKIALGTGVAALLVGGAIIVALRNSSHSNLNDKSPALKVIHDSQTAYAALSSYSDTGKGVQEVMGTIITSTFSVHLARPNFYRVEWDETQTQVGMTMGSKKAIWSAGDGDFRLGRAGAERMESREIAFGGANSATGSIPGDFFGTENHNSLGILAESTNLDQGNDDTVEGVECHTLTGKRQVSGGMTDTTTLWIGKKDHLIHQSKAVLENLAGIEIPDSMNATAKEALQRAIERSKGKPTVFTITRENISVNKPIQKSDFVHEESVSK